MSITFNDELWLDNPKRRKSRKKGGSKKSTRRKNSYKTTSYRSNPKKKRRSSRRKKNPPGMTDVITNTLIGMIGYIGAPLVRGRILSSVGMSIPSVLQPVVTGVAAYGLGWAATMFTSKGTGQQIMAGGMVKAASEFLIGQLNFPIGEYRMPTNLRPYAGMNYNPALASGGDGATAGMLNGAVNAHLTPRSTGRFSPLNY